ncbi:metal-dependent transcriptional regulator [Nanchangia anserum]|uniref:Manganese transport regulator n=1 Tax=Nanchangia anserum TaxID=2692125 RepID=A0A8I0G8J0_9ACTO|nr:metal-dependent transcriptional regulator [Nanchangia anserum]MBD3689114.1 metal-dependent transcriptional regulator [Nanchangia anserum]QOX81349.1 metal-dependent transcriptional regulator [Nanchangia anserum]
MSASARAWDSAVTQDYVKHIYSATEWGGKPISVTGLAARVGVTASTASETVRRLADAGLVEHTPYRGVELTAAGQERALVMIRRHRVVETYLHARLGYDWDEVHEEAEALEHAVSDRLIERMDAELGHPATDPHGDPIPSAGGAVDYPAYVDLTKLGQGRSSVVLRISDHEPALLRFFEEHGVRPGITVCIAEEREYAGTIVVEVGDGGVDSLELAPQAAQAVWVRA